MRLFDSWRPTADRAADLKIPDNTPNRDALVTEIVSLVNKELDGREARVEAREAKLEKAREALAAVHRFTVATLADNGGPAVAAAFEAEFNRRLGMQP